MAPTMRLVTLTVMVVHLCVTAAADTKAHDAPSSQADNNVTVSVERGGSESAPVTHDAGVTAGAGAETTPSQSPAVGAGAGARDDASASVMRQQQIVLGLGGIVRDIQTLRQSLDEGGVAGGADGPVGWMAAVEVAVYVYSAVVSFLLIGTWLKGGSKTDNRTTSSTRDGVVSPQGVLMNQAVRNVGSPDSGVNVALRRRVVPPAKLSHSRITVSDLRRSLHGVQLHGEKDRASFSRSPSTRSRHSLHAPEPEGRLHFHVPSPTSKLTVRATDDEASQSPRRLHSSLV
eukprot:m.174220 g.174220  ORF g.174220 m.174220 type:complete len:288 (-) comp13801_c0_seq1:141-1004(-)